METLAYLNCADECADETPNEQPGLLNGLKPAIAALPKVLSLLVGLLIVTSATAAMALQKGDRGSEVSELQRQLATAGCFNGPVTGVFAELTEQAVIACQRRFGLRPDGIAGPATLNALARTPRPNNSGVLRLGSQGPAVADVQRRLTQLNYYFGPADGLFGAATQDAVLRFQRDRGLFADGQVGTEVYRAFGVAPPPTNPVPVAALRPGATGARVEQLQRQLQRRGYFQESITGYYGTITTDAVARFQRENRLQPTGIADPQTLNLLGIDGGGTISYATNPYVVIIPKRDEFTLAEVRRWVPNAFLMSSKRGEYIQAGTYPGVEPANEQSGILRARGLDARVVYATEL
jgi:peptidoglycan hydrolase-like protein with peptidoglycan-binding domain